MPRFHIIETHDASGVTVGYVVIDLPGDHDGRAPFPVVKSSDSYFDTHEDAMEELMERVHGKMPCQCGCGGYPKGATSRFLPGHDLRKAYQDRPQSKQNQ